MRRAALISGIVLLAGCGGGDEADPEDAVAGAVRQYTSAFADGDLDKACGLLTERGRTQAIEGGKDFGLATCEAVLKQGRSSLTKQQLDGFRRASVTKVKITGGRASATLTAKFDGATPGPIRLRRENGAWRIDQDAS